jgi:pyruvate,water dikinase
MRIRARRSHSCAAAERRRNLAEEVERRLPQDAEKLAEFRRRLAAQERYLGLKEGRAMWQLSLSGVLRKAALAKGDRLVADGLLDSRDDIFYLLPAEIDGAGRPLAPNTGGTGGDRTGLRALVEARRAEHERWVGFSPPAKIGGEAAEAEAGLTEAEAGQVLKGTPASRGSYTGTARLLGSFEEYARLEPGDVLVCAMTTPAWTPLFPLAGAIVCDGGGMLSHTAVAAREYGIPAVVGVRNATRLIPDGARITVDGTAGTVTIG